MSSRPVRPVIVFLILAGLLGLPALSRADYPKRPIRLVVGYPPGGGADLMARVVVAEIGKGRGFQVVVDNRPGAEGALAAQIVSKAPPDGYTLLLIPFNMALSASIRRDLPYDPLKDFDAVALIASAPMALTVHPNVSAKTVTDLVSLAKSKPGGINYGSSGTGGTSHVSAELFKSLARIDLVHVPYRGSGPALLATISGEVDMCFGALPPILGHRKTGALRVLGVTSPKRSKVAPDIPAIAESLPGYEFATWYGLGAPAKTPRAIRLALHEEVSRVLSMSHVQTRLLNDGAEPVGSGPDDFHKHFAAEIRKWSAVIKNAGITSE